MSNHYRRVSSIEKALRPDIGAEARVDAVCALMVSELERYEALEEWSESDRSEPAPESDTTRDGWYLDLVALVRLGDLVQAEPSGGLAAEMEDIVAKCRHSNTVWRRSEGNGRL